MKELVLLSGGLDSAVCLFRAHDPVALFVDYGQPAAEQEREAAIALTGRRGCPLFTARATLQLGTMTDAPGLPGARVIGGRNAVLISLGVNTAVHTGRDVVWIGAQASDSDDYPDCRALFLTALDRLSRQTYGVGVAAPLIMASRANIAAEARHRVPPGLTWSCYTPVNGAPCQTCNSCRQAR